MNKDKAKIKKGSLNVITGPMFCGKSEELIRQLRLAKIAKEEVVVLKPKIDKSTRKKIKSRCGSRMKATPVSTRRQFFKQIGAQCRVLGIDEAQFFKGWILGAINVCLNRGIEVFVSGLDMDFLGRPFGPMPKILAKADNVQKLKAVCHKCRHRPSNAIFTQRLIDGEPASRKSPLIAIKDQTKKTTYQARCRDCFKIG